MTLTRERLELEVTVLELEVDLETALAEAGVSVPGKRAPFEHELRAGVRFAELDRIVDQAAGRVAGHAAGVRAAVVEALSTRVAELLDTDDPAAALKLVLDLTDPTSPTALPGVAEALERATDAIAEELLETAAAGAREALAEAARQGVPAASLPTLPAATDTAREAARLRARRVAQQPVTRLLDVANAAAFEAARLPGASGADVLLAASDAADEASTKGTEDLSRRAANVAHASGRAEGQARLPGVREVYASELLDSDTCGPCSRVDGRTYATLDDALEDYPGFGGFRGCDGGERCRGTLVLVHDTEAAPTLDNPGDRRPPPGPGGTDRTPRGPATPAPVGGPAALAPPDPGVPAAVVEAGLSVVDDAGVALAPAPAAQVPSLADVEPSRLEVRDLELEAETTEDLERLLAFETDHDELTRIADELDRRDLGVSGYDPDAVLAAQARRAADADELPEAAAAAAFEEAEAAGLALVRDTFAGYSGARAKDRAAAAWTDEAHRRALDAERATTGVLLRRDRLAEFRRKYGSDTSVLFVGPARVAYYYASPELREHWQATTRLTYAEFAVASGIRDRKTLERARAATEARNDAEARADENPEARRERKREADRRRRRGV